MSNKVINLFGNNKVVQNEGVKYSKLLEQFIGSFIHDFKEYEYVEDIFEFAINTWNLGNMKVIMSKEEFKEVISIASNEDVDVHLLKKMTDFKSKKFKEYTNFIVDFELKELNDGGDPVLNVITQEEDAYLANMLNGMEENDLYSQDDHDENYINRSAIIIKPKQPFIDWCSNLNPEFDFEEEFKETNIYLIDETIDDIEKWLKKKFDKFFMLELDSWHTNKKEWPQRRNYKMFKQWFQVETSKMIYDLEKEPVFK